MGSFAALRTGFALPTGEHTTAVGCRTRTTKVIAMQVADGAGPLADGNGLTTKAQVWESHYERSKNRWSNARCLVTQHWTIVPTIAL
ncbi:MAG: hypothetical protein Fur005_32340 [Roseiflexaceae bacterium]